MSLANDPRVSSIINRVKNLITKPEAEWDVIAGESATIKSLYVNYALILAAIPALAGFIKSALIGYSAAGVTIRLGVGAALGTSFASYILTLVGVAALAFVVDFLAPKFQGTSSQINAFKLAIYSMTAGWIAGIFLIVPAIGVVLSLVGGIYSLYLFYLGVPKLMKTPKSQAGIFTIAALVVNFVVMFAINFLAQH